MEILNSQALDNVHIGIIILNSNLEIVSWNFWMEKHSGYSKSEVIGQLIHDFIPIFRKSIYQNMFHETIYDHHSWFCSSGIHKAYVFPRESSESNKLLRQNLQIDPLKNEEQDYVLIQVFDQTVQYKRINTLKSAIKNLESHQNLQFDPQRSDVDSLDPITGFLKPEVFEQSVAPILKTHINEEHKSYLIYIKITSYSKVLQDYGLDSANNLIKEISRRMSKNIDIDTIISRSIDSFLLFVPNYNDFEIFIEYVTSLLTSISFKYYIDKTAIHTTPKIGISVFPDDGNTISTIVKCAKNAQINIHHDLKTNYSFYNNMLEALNKVHLNLHESQIRYQLLFDNMEEGFLCAEAIFDEASNPIDAKIIEANSYMAKLFNVSKNDILGKDLTTLLSQFTQEDFELSTALKNILIDENSIKISEQYFETIDKWFSINIYKISADCFSIMLSDITDNKKHEDVILRMAYYDSLTQLPNRKMFFDHATHIFEMAKRTSASFAIAFIDFNNFKIINDLLGHDVGDQVLIKGADFLKNGVRKSDFVARIGGDEFIILFTNVNHKKDITHLLDRLLDRFCIVCPYNDEELKVTISIGISFYPEHGAHLNEIIAKADEAMYKAKATKEHMYLFYE